MRAGLWTGASWREALASPGSLAACVSFGAEVWLGMLGAVLLKPPVEGRETKVREEMFILSVDTG